MEATVEIASLRCMYQDIKAGALGIVPSGPGSSSEAKAMATELVQCAR